MFAVQLSRVWPIENMGTISFEKVKLVYALHTFLRHTLHKLVKFVLQQDQQIQNLWYESENCFHLQSFCKLFPSILYCRGGSMSLETTFMHWKITVSTFCWDYISCRMFHGEFVKLQEIFLRLNYVDITKNTYVWHWMVMEILTLEQCGLVVPQTVPAQRDVFSAQCAGLS